MAARKIVLFGGTFDPIHLGHTVVAEAAAEHIGADKIIFIPAKRSPLKDSLPRAGYDDRLAMMTLAIAGNEKFQMNDYELKKTGPSYTLETVRCFQTQLGSDTSIYWLVGADSIDELPHWYKVIELIDECDLCVMFRASYDPPDFTKFEPIWGAARVEKLQRNIIPTPLIDISSTEIRNRLAAGLDVSDMLAPSVADYIHKRGIYQSKAKN
ncbi:MAG: nicotinate (nicotinamide) nucleotide adenylyltransferase [Planctomycetota bacterium]|jgi:nicotinate-nucleotide adenylyltransferase